MKITKKNGKEFGNPFDSYLYGLTEIFGNKGLLILLGESRISQEELVEKVYNLKMEIRKKYTNNNVAIATNYVTDNTDIKNYIKLVSENGEQKEPRILNEIGNHRINDLNIIHSPDPDVEDTLTELKIIVKNGLIKEENRIIPEIMNKIKKYQTLNITKDMKEEGYQGEIGPNISGFYESEIEGLEL